MLFGLLLCFVLISILFCCVLPLVCLSVCLLFLCVCACLLVIWDVGICACGDFGFWDFGIYGCWIWVPDIFEFYTLGFRDLRMRKLRMLALLDLGIMLSWFSLTQSCCGNPNIPKC